jgi:ABC-2 type transport system ATP-binding protein
MIEIKNVSKSYTANKMVLNNLNIHVNKGEIFGLLGVNGAGKTTLIKIMIGLQSENQGKIYLKGMHLKEQEVETKKSFYFLSDHYEVYRCITGEDWIRFVLCTYGVEYSKCQGAIEAYSARFELKDVLNQMIGTYSLGMRNKLGIMIGFLVNPPILILDEPMHGLDPYAIIAYRELLKEYASKGGTVFFSTHLIDIAHRICTRIAILHNGNIVRLINEVELSHIKDLELEFMESTKI